MFNNKITKIVVDSDINNNIKFIRIINGLQFTGREFIFKFYIKTKSTRLKLMENFKEIFGNDNMYNVDNRCIIVNYKYLQREKTEEETLLNINQNLSYSLKELLLLEINNKTYLIMESSSNNILINNIIEIILNYGLDNIDVVFTKNFIDSCLEKNYNDVLISQKKSINYNTKVRSI